jgi:hypothetical protein
MPSLLNIDKTLANAKPAEYCPKTLVNAKPTEYCQDFYQWQAS